LTLEAEEGRLRYASQRRPITGDEIRWISHNREEILLYLRAERAARYFPIEKTSAPLAPSITQEMWWRWIDKTVSLVLPIIGVFTDTQYSAVESALRTVMDRNDVLRSSFSISDGELRLTLNDCGAFEVENELLPSANDQASSMCVASSINEFIARPILHTHKWLASAKIISLSNTHHIAVLVANHIIIDGHSVRLLRSQLSNLARGQSLPTSGGELCYADYVVWQRKWQQESQHQLANYWSCWTRRKPQLFSPSGQRLVWRKGTKERYRFNIPRSAHYAVVQWARKLKTSVFLIYLTLFAKGIAEWAGQNRLAVRSIADGRVLPGMASIVGLLNGADALEICFREGADFDDHVNGVTEEYYSSAKLRTSSIYSFPPHMDHRSMEGGDWTENVEVVINYQVANNPLSTSMLKEMEWPPKVECVESIAWPHHVSPVCLEITNRGEDATCAFLLHAESLKPKERTSLMASFFAQISKYCDFNLAGREQL